MADALWRRLEREATGNPDDRDVLERAILARIRVGDVAPLPLLERWLRPALDRYGRELAAGAGTFNAPTAKALLDEDPVKQVALLGFALARMDLFLGCRRVSELLGRLLRRTTLPVRAVDLIRMIEGARRSGGTSWRMPWPGILRQAELCIERNGVAPELRDALLGIRNARVEAFKGEREHLEIATRAERLLGAKRTAVSASVIQPGERWSNQALAQVAALPQAEQAAWAALLDHAASSKSGQPGKRWLAKAEELSRDVGDSFGATVSEWLELVTANPDRVDEFGDPAFAFVAPANLSVLRGLAFCMSHSGAAAVAPLRNLAAYCYAKVPERGPRSAPLANACVSGLGLIGKASIPGLEELHEEVSHRSSRTSILRALERANGRAPAQKKRVKKSKPAPIAVPEVPFDQPDRDRELVESLLELQNLRPMQRMFVDDVKRSVLSLNGTLTVGQRKTAKGLLGRD
jgi:hypothetical protein